MTYSRKHLQKLRNSPRDKKVIEDLLGRFHDGDALTLGEEDVTCGILKILRGQDGHYAYDVSKLGGCENYYFRHIYLMYAFDLDGINDIYAAYRRVSDGQKKIDVQYLESQFHGWNQKVSEGKTGDVLLDHLIDETQLQVGTLNRYCKLNHIAKERKEYLIKSLFLHSKYIFLLVKEYYQEVKVSEDIIEIHGCKIVIDPYCYVHTLFRHLGAMVKDYQVGKTYHIDEQILFKSLPSFLARIVVIVKRNCCKLEFNRSSINIIFNRRKYVIWLKSIPAIVSQIHCPIFVCKRFTMQQ